MRTVALLALAFVAVSCGAGKHDVTVYLEQRLGPDGPAGQLAPVLEPTARERRQGIGAGAQALLQLRQGPTPDERAKGMRAPVGPATRLRLERVEGGTAFVQVLGQPLDVMGVASIVFSLTELPDVARVRVCCLHRHDGTRVFVHTRSVFHGWAGEPCAARREHRCLRDA